jgi:fatty-acyl-CoA synthase
MSPDIPAYIQFSSGSTAHPKGIVITQAALMHNVTGIATTGLRIGHDDRAFSWLPFYHDMGLVGFSIVALCAQRSVDYLSPTTFASRPMAWLKLMSAQRSSIVYAPGFAWRLAARCVRQEDVIDLGALRIAGVGGDMISAENLQECTSALAAVGLRPSAFQPGYGMAECTLAISMADPDLKPLIDHSTGTPYVGCGRPLPGLEVQVVDDAGRRLPEGGAGRIQVRGPSVTQHYYGASNEPSSGAEDGYFDTGDLGYMRAGEIFPTGRSKELIIVRGRNLWPQDIEREVGRLPGIAEGQVAAISVPGPFEEETLVLLLQRVPADAVQRAELAERVVESVNKAFGLAARVVFLPPNSLPVTSSGKLARVVARNRYLAGEWRAHSEGNSEVEAHA